LFNLSGTTGGNLIDAHRKAMFNAWVLDKSLRGGTGARDHELADFSPLAFQKMKRVRRYFFSSTTSADEEPDEEKNRIRALEIAKGLY
jgi:hypothetical protein